uniref:Uncharacterized protein n=1 Tax=Timema tahoe TaxID=61484 RepID=A0A7R9IQ46_9NEOP|nr:unnamed protein product [Timema tahoe]
MTLGTEREYWRVRVKEDRGLKSESKGERGLESGSKGERRLKSGSKGERGLKSEGKGRERAEEYGFDHYNRTYEESI